MIPNSNASEMKTTSVTTWNERPTMETSTAVLLPPEDVEDRALPTACKIRERILQGIKTQ